MKKILIVDDSPMIRELLKGVLEPEGYEVLLAEDGEEALEQAKNITVDLFIVDIFLPKKGGAAGHGGAREEQDRAEDHRHIRGGILQSGIHSRACEHFRSDGDLHQTHRYGAPYCHSQKIARGVMS